jgi:hypothetical protein
MSSSLEPTRERIAALAARPADAPVVMVNLLKFKQPGGLERYLQYGQGVAPHLERIGGKVRYGGTAPTVVIGDGERPWWEAILIVEYPSPAAFIEMVTGTFLGASLGRWSGVSPSRLSPGAARRSEWSGLAVDVLLDDDSGAPPQETAK